MLCLTVTQHEQLFKTISYASEKTCANPHASRLVGGWELVHSKSARLKCIQIEDDSTVIFGLHL